LIAEEALRKLGKEGIKILDSSDYQFVDRKSNSMEQQQKQKQKQQKLKEIEEEIEKESIELEEKVLLSRLTLLIGICEWKIGAIWSLERNEREKKALELVKKSLSIDPIDPTSLAIHSILLSLLNQHSKGIYYIICLI